MTYTQLDDLAFLQMSSLFGITFGSFFIYISSAFIASFIVFHDKKILLKPALMMIGVFALFYSYGVVRLENMIGSPVVFLTR
jgi:apolipoprotein N-acyltransferase